MSVALHSQPQSALPSSDQIQSLIRGLLAAGGPAGAWLLSRGVSQDALGAYTNLVVALLGAVPFITSIVWGLMRHTDSGNLAAVEAIPAVRQITVSPVAATPNIAAVVADPERAKVVSSMATPAVPIGGKAA